MRIGRIEVDSVIIEGEHAIVDGKSYHVHGMVVVMSPTDEPAKVAGFATLDALAHLIVAATVIGREIANHPDAGPIIEGYNADHKTPFNIGGNPSREVH